MKFSDLVSHAVGLRGAICRPDRFGGGIHPKTMTGYLLLQNNRPALIEPDQMERVLADVDADRVMVSGVF